VQVCLVCSTVLTSTVVLSMEQSSTTNVQYVLYVCS
jgi:hypothetical protein